MFKNLSLPCGQPPLPSHYPVRRNQKTLCRPPTQFPAIELGLAHTKGFVIEDYLFVGIHACESARMASLPAFGCNLLHLLLRPESGQ